MRKSPSWKRFGHPSYAAHGTRTAPRSRRVPPPRAQLFKWATTTPAGNATLFVACIVLAVICLGCCWQLCSSHNDKQLTQETVRLAVSNMGSMHQLPRIPHPAQDVHPSRRRFSGSHMEMTGAGASAGIPNQVSGAAAYHGVSTATYAQQQPVHAVSQPPGVQQPRWTAQAGAGASPQPPPPQHQPPPPPQYGNAHSPQTPPQGRRASAAPALDPRLMAALHQGPRS